MPETPLLARHEKAGARLAEEAGWRMPRDFGDPEAEHRACREGAIVMDLSHWGKLAFSGPDAVPFLHGMLTNGVQDLKAGEGVYAAFLTRQGKFVSDLHLYRRAEDLLALVPPGMSGPLAGALDHFIIMDQVEVAERTEALCALGLFGPGAPDIAARAGLPWPEGGEHRHVVRDEIMAARELWTGEEGCILLVPRDLAGGAWERLASAGARPAGLGAFETLTLEAGVPLFGKDMGPEVNPMQAGLETRVLDFQKGCYIGQEVIARLDTYAKVKQRLMGLELPEGLLPAAGTLLRAGTSEAGHLTSAVRIPGQQGGIALAYVRREHWQPDTLLQLEGCAQPVPVVQLPGT